MKSNRKVEIKDLAKDHAGNLSESELSQISGGLIVTFKNVIVSNYSVGGSSAGYGGPDSYGGPDARFAG